MRAYRSPAETRFSGVFSAATTRMQSAGQAAAHSEQPTHFSSPVSSKRCSLCRPRKLGYAGERRLEALERRAEGTGGAPHGAGLRRAHDLHDVGSGFVSHVTTTRIAVTSALSVASGRRIFHPSAISWS